MPTRKRSRSGGNRPSMPITTIATKLNDFRDVPGYLNTMFTQPITSWGNIPFKEVKQGLEFYGKCGQAIRQHYDLLSAKVATARGTGRTTRTTAKRSAKRASAKGRRVGVSARRPTVAATAAHG